MRQRRFTDSDRAVISQVRKKKKRKKVIKNIHESQLSRGVDPSPGPRTISKRTDMIGPKQKPKK